METILVLIHSEADGTLAKSALEVLGAAKTLGGSLVAGVIGENVQAAANVIAGCGATRFFGVSGAEFSQARYGTDAAAATAVSPKPTPAHSTAPWRTSILTFGRATPPPSASACPSWSTRR